MPHLVAVAGKGERLDVSVLEGSIPDGSHVFAGCQGQRRPDAGVRGKGNASRRRHRHVAAKRRRKRKKLIHESATDGWRD